MKVVIAGSRNVQVLNLEAEKSFSPPGSKSTSLYCGSIFDPPSNAKNPANLTACGVSWSWQCDSNTRPADYESAALPTELCQHLSNDLIIISKERRVVKGFFLII